MLIWAIVPVKPLYIGKSRLSSILSPEERLALNSQLLIHTLVTLKSIPQVKQILVVSRDRKALALARAHGARTLQENGSPQLNVALQRATMLVQNFAVSGVLVLPADLPLISPDDIQAIVHRGQQPPVVVIAPDRHRQGTNGLFISPPGLIEYKFGTDSFQRHCQGAQKAGARLEIVEFQSLALDVDLPEDLELIAQELISEPM